jgi:hypothetical protein
MGGKANLFVPCLSLINGLSDCFLLVNHKTAFASGRYLVLVVLADVYI